MDLLRQGRRPDAPERVLFGTRVPEDSASSVGWWAHPACVRLAHPEGPPRRTGRILAPESELPRVPPAALGCLVAILVPFAVPSLWQVAVALRRMGEIDRIELLLTIGSSMVWLGILGGVAFAVFRRGWAPLTLRIDRESGAIEFVERNILTRRERRETFPLMALAGFTVETITGRRAQSAPSSASSASPLFQSFTPNVRIKLRLDDGSRKPRARVLSIHVEGVDRREEVADFAYRLGAACGLGYQRVVRSDPRDIELDVSASMGPGHDRIPPLEGRANYAANVFSAAAGAPPPRTGCHRSSRAVPCDHKVSKGCRARGRLPQAARRRGHRILPSRSPGCLPDPPSSSIRRHAARHRPRRPSRAVRLLRPLRPDLRPVALAAVASASRRATIDRAADHRHRRAVHADEIPGGRVRRRGPLRAHVPPRRQNSSSYHSYRCEVQLHRRDPRSRASPVLVRRRSSAKTGHALPAHAPLVTELAARRSGVDVESRAIPGQEQPSAGKPTAGTAARAARRRASSGVANGHRDDP